MCLALSALLLLCLPSLLARIAAQDGQRMAPRLRPQKSQTLTVWIMQDSTAGQKALNRQIALFEEAVPGVRVFLRKADQKDLTAPEAVLPDVLLFSPGAFMEPEKYLLPYANPPGEIAGALSAGQSQGQQYALPLWFAPAVLAVPLSALPQEVAVTPRPTESSLFQLATPPPTENPDSTEAPQQLPDIPWQWLAAPGNLAMPQGMALQQLLFMCPLPMRPAFVQNISAPLPTAAPAPGGRAGKASAPTPTPAPRAQVMTLAACQAAVAEGKALFGFPLAPAATQNVLLLGLCRSHELARSFASHLLSPKAQASLYEQFLLPAMADVPPPGDGLSARLSRLYQSGLLFPNAFAYTSEELASFCRDAFLRVADPVETLLRLR